MNALCHHRTRAAVAPAASPRGPAPITMASGRYAVARLGANPPVTTANGERREPQHRDGDVTEPPAPAADQRAPAQKDRRQHDRPPEMRLRQRDEPGHSLREPHESVDQRSELPERRVDTRPQEKRQHEPAAAHDHGRRGRAAGIIAARPHRFDRQPDQRHRPQDQGRGRPGDPSRDRRRSGARRRRAAVA